MKCDWVSTAKGCYLETENERDRGGGGFKKRIFPPCRGDAFIYWNSSRREHSGKNISIKLFIYSKY